MSNLIDAERPWPGLLPFTEDARAFFHGRETETDELYRFIEREPLTVLFGQSGLGKSSLLRAGVFPLLRRASHLPVYLRLNLEVDAPPLIDQVWQAIKAECAANEVSATTAVPGDSFWKYLHRTDTRLLNLHRRTVSPVLVFDQFEELFTIGRQTPEQNARCQGFLEELGELIENRLPPAFESELTDHPERLDQFDLLRQNLKIVFAFREDYLAEFEGLKVLIRPIMQNRMRLSPMNGNLAAKAIRQAGAGRVSEVVAARIVRFVGGAKGDQITGLEQVPVEPALLSLVCHELNEQRIARNETQISVDLIQGDNAQHIIEQFYNQGFAGFDVNVRHFVEDHLLTAAGYRDSYALDNALTTANISEADVQILVDRRILRREERGGLVRLELIHDVLAAVAKASRDSRREADALAAAQLLIAKQRRRQRWVAAAAGVALIVLAGVSWLAVEAELARADAAKASVTANTALAEAKKQTAMANLALKKETDARNREAAALADAQAQSAEAKKQAKVAFSRGLITQGNEILDGHTAHAWTAGPLLALEARSVVMDVSTLGMLMKARAAVEVKDVVMSGPQQSPILSVAFSPDGKTLATGSAGKTLRVWDVASRQPLGEPLRGHENVVNSVAFSPDGKILATGSADKTVRLWDVASRKPLGEPLRGHEEAVYSVAFSPDGKTLASGSRDKTVRLWNVASRQPLGEPLRGHGDVVYSVAFSPDGKTLASASADKTVRLWDVTSRQPLGEPLRGHEDYVNSVAFSPDGKTLATGSTDRTVRLWDVASRQPLGEPLRGHEDVVYSVAFSPDGKTLATGSWDKTVRLWDVASRKPLGEPLHGHEEAVYAVAFSPDGKTLATGSSDKTVRLWNVASRQPLGAPLRGHEDSVNSVAFSPDGKTLATGSSDKTVRLWDVASRQPLGGPLRGHGDSVNSVAFSPNGKTLATGSADKTARLWDIISRQPLGKPLRGHGDSVNSVAFSPDGKTLATGSADKTVRLWDIISRQPVGEPLRGQEDSIKAVAISPDGKTLAAGSADKTVRLWDVASRKPLGEPLRGHEDVVFSVAFSPDGKTLATGSWDMMVRLWDVASRKPLGEPLHGHDSVVSSVAFSPDGKTLGTGSWDTTARLWDVDFASWHDELCDRLPRNLTRAEWNDFIGDFIPYGKTCPNLPLPN